MSRLKKTIASGAVAALSGTGAFIGLGSHAAHASTPLNSTTAFPFGPPLTLSGSFVDTLESELGTDKYDCSVYTMNLMLLGQVEDALDDNTDCGYEAGEGVGVGFIF